MSTTGFIVTLVVTIAIYVAANLLTRVFPHGGRDPVVTSWTLSQWDPNGIRPQSSCAGPTIPGNCIIEGVQTVSSQTAWRTCAASVCIDFDGANVKGDMIVFQATCPVPYCSWSQCLLTFNGGSTSGKAAVYVKVSEDNPAQLTIASSQTDATLFYMNRLTIDSQGNLVSDQNGTLARFFILPRTTGESSQVLQILGYSNGITGPDGVSKVTKLTASVFPPQGFEFLDIFLLLEELSQTLIGTPAPSAKTIPRKILVFGGEARQANPPNETLASFVTYSTQTMWKALQFNAPMRIISWRSDSTTVGGFYGLQDDDYVSHLTSADAISQLLQDALETRLKTSGALDRTFYNWTV